MRTTRISVTFVMSVLSLALAVAAVGCGDDSKSSSNDGGTSNAGTSAGTGGAGGTGSSGTGGTSGSAGTSAGTGGTGGAKSVSCGSETCMLSGALAQFALPCCADEAKGSCGVSFGGACMESPPADPRCESVTIMSTLTLSGCCTADNQCGLDTSIVGMKGCKSLVDLKAQAAGRDAGVGGMTIPEPHACDEEDAGR